LQSKIFDDVHVLHMLFERGEQLRFSICLCGNYIYNHVNKVTAANSRNLTKTQKKMLQYLIVLVRS